MDRPCRETVDEAGIAFEDVSFGYTDTPVLTDLSVVARKGEFLAIVGPNGCGKTTALKLMVGLYRPLQGAVRIGGRDLNGLSRRALAREVALLTQMASVPAEMSVYDMIAMGRFAHQGLLQRRSQTDEAMIAEAVLSMQVQSLQGRRVGELSGGQLQRCRMAMVLAQGAGTLLLDEPTTYLDLKHQYGILECAADQARRGRCVVAVMHDFTQAALYADRIAVMHEGRIAGLGTPDEVLTEDMVARVFDVRTRVARAHGAVIHVPAALADRPRETGTGRADADFR